VKPNETPYVPASSGDQVPVQDAVASFVSVAGVPSLASSFARSGTFVVFSVFWFSNERSKSLTLPALSGSTFGNVISTVIGSRPYVFFAEEYRKPVVIAGFEPLDVMQAIRMLIRQVNEGRAEVENEFTRAVTEDGNLKAQALVAETFELRRSFEWRGLHEVPYSALRIRSTFAAWDAERKFGLTYAPVADNKACECGAILRGVKKPTDCKIFGTVCTPENPMGSCMVSSEGACAAHYNYGRFRDVPIPIRTETREVAR